MSYKQLEKEEPYRDSANVTQTESCPSPKSHKSILQRITSSPMYVGGNGCFLIVNILFLLVAVNKIISLRQYCPAIPYGK